MKLKVLKNFWDKNTGEPRKVGDIIDVSKERAEELLKHQLELVEIVDEIIKETKEIEAKAISEDTIVLEAKETKPKRTKKKAEAK